MAQTLLPAVSLRITFSLSIDVVASCGPGLLPFSFPNFANCLRSATTWSTTVFCIFFRIFLVTWRAFHIALVIARTMPTTTHLHFLAIVVDDNLLDRDDAVLVNGLLWLREFGEFYVAHKRSERNGFVAPCASPLTELVNVICPGCTTEQSQVVIVVKRNRFSVRGRHCYLNVSFRFEESAQRNVRALLQSFQEVHTTLMTFVGTAFGQSLAVHWHDNISSSFDARQTWHPRRCYILCSEFYLDVFIRVLCWAFF